MKPQQLESQLARVVSEAIGTLEDPRVPMIVTVEAVSMTPDYAQARVYISSLGDMPALLEALRGARGYLQRQVAENLNMRRTPILEFFDIQDRKW